MAKFLTLAIILLSITACGQRVGPLGPKDIVSDTSSY